MALTTRGFYLLRAAECAKDAAAADLANVRKRMLDAERAWLSLANRASGPDERAPAILPES